MSELKGPRFAAIIFCVLIGIGSLTFVQWLQVTHETLRSGPRLGPKSVDVIDKISGDVRKLQSNLDDANARLAELLERSNKQNKLGF